MHIEQIYTGCLAQGAYYIRSENEAAIIDPLRETSPYTSRAEKDGVKIKYIFETHFHADFVSGHVDLAKKTGAKIVFGPNAKTTYASHIGKDGEEFKIGKITIKLLHTPGHTLESSTFLLLDENNKPHAIFSGDTLFIGDVGRPDLAIKSDLTQEDLAGMLYDSLQNKIKSLPDDVIVYPGHGAGSACGKNMSKETFDTLGNQKQKNYALIMNSKTDFVKELTAGIMPPPQYFAKNAQLNKMGYSEFDSVLQKGYTALSPQQAEDLANNENALILDVRKPNEFAESHVPNSIFIGIDGQFAPWVGALIKDLQQPIVLLAPAGREQEIITRLSRVGYDNCLGYLEGGIDAWKNAGKETSNVISISAQEFSDKIKSGINTIDVRKPGEYDSQHVENVPNQPLDFINDWTDTLDKSKTYHIHCAGGYRSMIAASILKARGFEKLVDVTGGFSAIEKTNAPLTCAKTCASKNV